MSEIKSVLIIANTSKVEAASIAREISDYLKEKNISSEIISTDVSQDKLDVGYGYDMVVTLGGDGTVLYASRSVCSLGIPILPINLGTFGYITEVGKDEWKEAFEAYVDGNLSNLS